MHASEITIAYGLTEASPVMTQTRTDDPIELKVATVGQHLPGHRGAGSWTPRPARSCAAGRRGRALLPRLQRHEGLLQDARGHRRRPSTRTAGCTPATSASMDENGQLPDHRPDQGHDHPRRGERLSRGRSRSSSSPWRGSRTCRWSGVASEKYGEEVGAFIILKDGAALDARRTCGLLPGQDLPLQDPEVRLLRGRLPHDRQRQDPEVQAARDGPGRCSKERGIEII